MQYSPKLKIAMDEIKSILKKHDIAGFVVLHTPGFAEYLNNISPSYSCAKLENGEMRFKLVTKDVGGKERAKEIATSTLNMIQILALQISRHAMVYMDAEEKLNKAWPNDKTEGSDTSHNQQNN